MLLEPFRCDLGGRCLPFHEVEISRLEASCTATTQNGNFHPGVLGLSFRAPFSPLPAFTDPTRPVRIGCNTFFIQIEPEHGVVVLSQAGK